MKTTRKVTNQTCVRVLTNCLYDSKNFRNNILKLFKESFNPERYRRFFDQYNFTIKEIQLINVHFGRGYGRFSSLGQGVDLKIICDVVIDNEVNEVSEYFYLLETIDSFDYDKLSTLEYGTINYSNALKRICLRLLRNEIDGKITDKLVDLCE